MFSVKIILCLAVLLLVTSCRVGGRASIDELIAKSLLVYEVNIEQGRPLVKRLYMSPGSGESAPALVIGSEVKLLSADGYPEGTKVIVFYEKRVIHNGKTLDLRTEIPVDGRGYLGGRKFHYRDLDGKIKEISEKNEKTKK